MAGIVGNLKSIDDYRRAEEEFQLKKQKAMADKSALPAALQMANSIQSDLDASNTASSPEEAAAYRQRANLKAQSAKMFDKGLSPYGNGDGGGMVLPTNSISVPTKPEEPQGILPQLLNALQGQKTPITTPAWKNPNMVDQTPMGVQPIQGYGTAAGSIEADKKRMERQAEKNVDLTMNPQIAGKEADAKNTSELKFATPIAGAKKKGDIDATQIGDLQKKADSAANTSQLTARARAVLQTGLPTGSYGGAIRDFGKRVVGSSDAGTQANAALDVIAGNLTSNVPRMEGPQSDADRIYYAQQAGRVNDKTLPVADRLAALDAIDAIGEKYKGLNTPQQEALEEIPTGGKVYPAEAAAAKLDANKVPMKAAQALRADPSLAADFDTKYGRGAANMVLGK